jgi:hypothetical protein
VLTLIGNGLTNHNLPPRPAPFVGRQPELASLDRYLTDPTRHLIKFSAIGRSGNSSLNAAGGMVPGQGQRLSFPPPPRFQ